MREPNVWGPSRCRVPRLLRGERLQQGAEEARGPGPEPGQPLLCAALLGIEGFEEC